MPVDRDDNPLCLLAVHAHPDDEASKGAGTVARYNDEGVRAVLVCCTGGEAGDILNPAVDTPEIRADLHRVRMQELEERALFMRGGLTRLVDRIEAAGLVRREPVPGDRRGVRIVLTPDGQHRYDASLLRHREVIEREFGRRLTPAQHRAIADALWPWWHDAARAATARKG